jgi:hypothetical protein
MAKMGAISLASSLAVWSSETLKGNRNIILCQGAEFRNVICLRYLISWPFGLLEFRANIQSCELIQRLLDLLRRDVDLSQLLSQNNKTLMFGRQDISLITVDGLDLRHCFQYKSVPCCHTDATMGSLCLVTELDGRLGWRLRDYHPVAPF